MLRERSRADHSSSAGEEGLTAGEQAGDNEGIRPRKRINLDNKDGKSAGEKERLKQRLESEMAAGDEEDVSVESAARLLRVESIDKAYAALMNKARASQFKYNESKAAQSVRPYQRETLYKLSDFIRQGAGTVAVQLPTGAGKTFVIHKFIYQAYLRKGCNVLVVTPSWEIANQHAMTVCQHFKDGERRIRRLGGQSQLISLFPEYASGTKGTVIITTAALFYARQKLLREKLATSAIVIDEGHHGWKKKRLNSVQSLARELNVPAILLTATPPLNMEHLPFAAQLKYLDLVPEYLVPCEVIRLETGHEFKPVLRNGSLAQSSRVEISSRATRFEKIVAESIPHLDGQTIYYAGSVREAMGVLEAFTRHRVAATVVHSQWAAKGTKINALAIDQFRRGEVQVLVNVQMLAMGFDVPNVKTIIVARPVESDTLFTQMVGRGARPSEGKERFILIDVHDTISKPDVAKIFEHKHLFYADTVNPESASGEDLEMGDSCTDLGEGEQIAEINGFPWRNGVRENADLDFHALHFLRCPALIRYFLYGPSQEVILPLVS